MLDQSFSSENFNIIFEIENRKGTFDKNFFSAKYYDIAQKLIDKRKEIKDYKNKSLEDLGYKNLLNEKEKLIENKDNILIKDLREYSKIVNSNNFSIDILPFKFNILDAEEKIKYKIKKNDAASFFAMKQLQHNINRTFNVKQSNRYLIVEQIKSLLQDNLPKYIVRTDIKGFYENVPQEKLLNLINENQLLSPKSKKLIKNLLYTYNHHTNQLKLTKSKRKGIPRGAGVSAYLAELYMKEIDKKIKDIKDLNYYCRYVDDMFAIFSPSVETSTKDYYLKKIEGIVTSRGLLLKKDPDPNKIKTFECNVFDENKKHKIGFLGYDFVIDKKIFTGVYLSQNKIEKYEKKINETLLSFKNDKKLNYKLAKKLLVHRLNYLTKNTRLEHPKKGLIGIYYSNSLLEKDNKSLEELNQILKNCIDIHITDTSLNKRLKRFDFKKGFNDKLFFNVNSKSNSKVVCNKGHKNIPDLRSSKSKSIRPLNNFEKITSIWKR